MQKNSPDTLIPGEKEGKQQLVSLLELTKLTGASFLPHLEFSPFSTARDVAKRSLKFQRKGILTREQIWLGTYFRQEILHPTLPDVFLRWIDREMGWGLFANRELRKMQFIAEYIGTVRRRKREDRKNSYCFEYLIAPGEKTPYTIDARERGGIARYINHSSDSNLTSALATCDGISHIILFAKKPIPKGAQLTYDYGPDYWAHRPQPRAFRE